MGIDSEPNTGSREYIREGFGVDTLRSIVVAKVSRGHTFGHSISARVARAGIVTMHSRAGGGSLEFDRVNQLQSPPADSQGSGDVAEGALPEIAFVVGDWSQNSDPECQKGWYRSVKWNHHESGAIPDFQAHRG